MKTILKYPLEITDEQRIEMPEGAQILCAQMQGESLVLWANVERYAPKRSVLIVITGTGLQSPDGSFSYVSTVQLDECRVWHVFQK